MNEELSNMKKLAFWISLAALVTVNGHMISLAETPDKDPSVNVGAAQPGQMTPTEKYNLLGKQTPSSDKPVADPYGAQPTSADPTAAGEACKDNKHAKQ
jgi:hypothetical protein